MGDSVSPPTDSPLVHAGGPDKLTMGGMRGHWTISLGDQCLHVASRKADSRAVFVLLTQGQGERDRPYGFTNQMLIAALIVGRTQCQDLTQNTMSFARQFTAEAAILYHKRVKREAKA